MALTHLADTSVLTRLGHRAVRTALEPLAASGQVARAGISALIETDAVHVRRARQVQRLLASRGLRGRKIPDLLIAAAAEENGLAVLHYDADFDLITRVTGQPCEWVVPAGTID